MSIPSFRHVVEEMAAKHPDAWHHAHRGGPRTEEFVRLLTARLHQMDPAIGLNGKRGNPSDISDDALCYKGVSVYGDVDPTRGNAPVTVIDFIGSAPSDYNGPNGVPAWSPVTDPNVRPTRAAWVQPEPVGEVVATPVVSDVWTPAHEALRARLGVLADALTVAQQLAYSFPDETWGQKRAGTSRPVSDDTVARKMPDGRLFGVRVRPPVKLWGILGAEQVFEPVAPVNFVGEPAVMPPVDPPPVEPPVVTPPVVPTEIAARLAAIEKAIELLAVGMTALAGTVEAQRQEVLDAVRGQSYKIDATADLGFGGKRKITGIIAPQAQE
jgi:hypothetical protein